MRRVALILCMALVWIAVLALCYRGVHALDVPMSPEPTFHAPLCDDEPSVDVVRITAVQIYEGRVRLVCRDAEGQRRVLTFPEEQFGKLRTWEEED